MTSIWLKCSWAQICVLLFLFSHTALAQQVPSPSNETQLASSILEYAKFLREEEKAHRDYLEKLYTNLGLLIAAGIALVTFFHYKTRADVQAAVDAQFQKTVQRELNNRVQRSMEEVKQVANQQMDAMFKSIREKTEEMVFAGDPGRVEGVDAKQAKPDVELTAAPSLDEQEKQILLLMDKGNYSFRSLFGITKDAGQIPGQSAGSVAQHLESLVTKGLLGKTLGKTGGERWFVTAEGRKYLLSPRT